MLGQGESRVAASHDLVSTITYFLRVFFKEEEEVIERGIDGINESSEMREGLENFNLMVDACVFPIVVHK